MNRSSAYRILSLLLLCLCLSLAASCGGGGGGDGGSSGGGNTGGSGGSSPGLFGTYEGWVAINKLVYGKSDDWEQWMIANKSRYEATYAASAAKSAVITVSFRYETAPIAYSPAWANEAEHMGVLATMAEGAYPGYDFDFVFNGDTNSSYANVIAGIATNNSYSSGKDIYLYYETIFNHEFGHTMRLPHHYDSVADIGNGSHMPPGDTKCIMDRNSTTFCSACRTALRIPLDATDTTAMDAAMADILARYPY